MATHSFSVPTHLNMLVIFSSKNAKRGQKLELAYFYAFWVGPCILGTCANCKHANGTLKVARTAFNIGEVWNSVCCHGNKTFKLIFWSTYSRILLQRIKHF